MFDDAGGAREPRRHRVGVLDLAQIVRDDAAVRASWNVAQPHPPQPRERRREAVLEELERDRRDSRSTVLFEPTMTTNRSAAAARAFSRVWAAPPPLTSQPDGATWSAPSIARSTRAGAPGPLNDSTLIPKSRAARSVARELVDAAHVEAPRRQRRQ